VCVMCVCVCVCVCVWSGMFGGGTRLVTCDLHNYFTLTSYCVVYDRKLMQPGSFRCCTPFLSTGNAGAPSVTPSTVHPSDTRKHVEPFQASPRDGLRSSSSDLEPQKKSKSHGGRKEICML